MKAKKSILSILLAVILLLSTFVLFACNKSESSEGAYKAYNEIVTTLKQDTSLFSKKKLNNLSTNFYLNDFSYKNSSGKNVEGYNNYVALNAVSLGFIEEYYPALENLTLKTDYSGLKNDVKGLKKSYEALKVEHDKLKNQASGLNWTIYNGYFARYRQSAQSFINKSFDCALSLGDFLNRKADLAKNFAKEGMTAEEVEFYYDFNLLKVFDDLREFFMGSCKGVLVENSVFESGLTVLLSYADDAVVNKEFTDTTVEDAQSLKDSLERVDADRALALKAFSKFSVYNYANNYQGSIEAYEKADSNASAYLNRIESYFTILMLV